VLKELAK